MGNECLQNSKKRRREHDDHDESSGVGKNLMCTDSDLMDGGSGPCGQPSERDADQQTGQAKGKKGPWSDPRVIYMKDTWRFLSDLPDVEVKAEHEIYAILHAHGTPNIPEHVAGGDVDGGRTQTQDFLDAPWLCVKPRIPPHQHYRLVHRIVGRALFKFECTKQLVTAVFDALKGTLTMI